MSAPRDAGTRTSKLGRYELITRIGEGGMAEVQLALQRGPAGFEKLVVVKLVHENLASQKDFVDMLLDEARVAALLKHPNVVDIYDLGQADGRFFIAMEYLEGEPLLAVLRAGREGKRLDILSTARLIADTAEGLDAAHELRSMGGDPIGLVHHDVSLGNIVVLYNGQVKLVDFGVAKATQSVSQQRRVQGKFSYMAPEKLRGAPGDRRSDLWSLGVVLWEALTLKRLFKGASERDTMRQVLESELPAPSKVNGEVATELDPIVMRALQRDPEQRYATAKEMATDLEEVLRTQGYGGKNDKIAKYMQATFASHIEARKRLLQEVSSKGRASADVLEAAFDDPAMLASGSSSQAEFLVRYKPNTIEIRQPSGPTRSPRDSSPGIRLDDPSRRRPEATPGHRIVDPFVQFSAATPPQLEYPRANPSDLPPIVAPDHGETEIDAPVIEIEAEPSSVPGRPPTLDPQAASPLHTGSTTLIGRLASSSHAYLVIAGATAVVAAIIIVIALRGGKPAGAHDAALLADPDAGGSERGSGSDSEPRPATGSDPAGDAVPDAAPAPDVPASPVEGGDPAVPKPPEPDLQPESSPKAPAKAPKTEKMDPAALYRSGINAYVLGDMKTAMSSFQRALAVNPSFAIAWRGVGLVHER
ncbi:MAG TPA: protein kinase, partial [Kofleriaceae bacterium]|nr:protein kinase [Kofleriaceae bacterium]